MSKQRERKWINAGLAGCLLVAGCANFDPPPFTTPGPYHPPSDERTADYVGMVNKKQIGHMMRTTFSRLSPAERQLVRRVNSQVNREITFLTDAANYGLADYAVTEPRIHRPVAWGYPLARYGDCEDYALTKKHRLVENGMSPSRLFVVRAVVPDESGPTFHIVVAVPEGNDWWVLNNWDDIIERASTLEKWWGWEFIWPHYDLYRRNVETRVSL